VGRRVEGTGGFAFPAPVEIKTVNHKGHEGSRREIVGVRAGEKQIPACSPPSLVGMTRSS